MLFLLTSLKRIFLQLDDFLQTPPPSSTPTSRSHSICLKTNYQKEIGWYMREFWSWYVPINFYNICWTCFVFQDYLGTFLKEWCKQIPFQSKTKATFSAANCSYIDNVSHEMFKDQCSRQRHIIGERFVKRNITDVLKIPIIIDFSLPGTLQFCCQEV